MKNKLLHLAAALLICAVILATSVLSQPVTSGPSNEFWIEVNASTNLNCNRIRVTSGSFVLDKSPTNWVVKFPIEGWRTNGAISVISRDELTLTMADLTAMMNAGNKLTAFKNAVKAQVNLVEKP